MRRCAAVLLVTVLIALPCARADIPPTMSYQGVLRDEAGLLVPDGDYVLTFRIYPSPAGTPALWTGVQTLPVADGVFNALLEVGGSLDFDVPYWLGISVGADPELAPKIALASSPYALRSAVADLALVANVGTDHDWTLVDDDMYAAVSGFVGIGIMAPLAHLHVQRTDIDLAGGALRNEDLIVEDADAVIGLYSDEGGSYGSAITLGELSAGVLTSKWSIHRTTGLNSQLRFAIGAEPGYNDNLVALTIGWGNIGLGTTDLAQDARLKIALREGTPMIPSPEGGILITDHLFNAGHPIQTRSHTGETTFVVHGNGMVGIGTAGPTEQLTVRGNLLLLSESSGDPILELGEGLDYAEGFDVSTAEGVGPGTVLIIDPAVPGRLTVSRMPYDRRVAGIVTGAGGLGSGVRLGSERFDCDIALAGRVYCNVDARETAVEPGDLLTTAAIPGHAMKVTDSPRAQGAILGKAMEPLARGRTGSILVLVTLQ